MEMRLVILLFFGFLTTGIQSQVIDTAVLKKIAITPENAINTENLEFAPAFYGDKIAFVYAGGNSEKIDLAIEEPFFDLVFAAKDLTGNLTRKAFFPSVINSELHEGPLAVAKGGNTIYFTRNEAKPVNTLADKDATVTMKIYSADLVNSEWKTKPPLNLSKDGYNVCHPALTADEKTMIFAGDLSDTRGKMDLYISRKDGENWSEPVNLGSQINGEGNDWFPHIVGDSILFFASDGGNGEGGLDIYVSKLIDGQWSARQNVGSPLNTQWDDFGFIWDPSTLKGYFSSNRPGGQGKDDLYQVQSDESIFYDPLKDIVSVKVAVLDKLSFRKISDADIAIVPLKTTQNKFDIENYDLDLLPGSTDGELLLKLSPRLDSLAFDLKSDINGNAEQKISAKLRYLIRVRKSGYEEKVVIYTHRINGPRIDIVLNPVVEEEKEMPVTAEDIFIPTTKGAVVIFENIYYDFNSTVIKAGAAVELDALANAMTENPSMEILLSAHTDARGTSQYNQDLSTRRALAAKNYLISKGILQERIIEMGFGESRLRNHCADGVECTEEEHQYNRRTEVKILEN